MPSRRVAASPLTTCPLWYTTAGVNGKPMNTEPMEHYKALYRQLRSVTDAFGQAQRQLDDTSRMTPQLQERYRQTYLVLSAAIQIMEAGVATTLPSALTTCVRNSLRHSNPTALNSSGITFPHGPTHTRDRAGARHS